jgi:hypothetical protein
MTTALGDAVRPFDDSVVLEMKFVDRMPAWFNEMVRVFGLVRGGAPKYAKGVSIIGEHRVSNRGVGLKVASASRPSDVDGPRGVPSRAAVAVA